MSPLWPESLQAGLFPGHCWLQKAGGKVRHMVSHTGASGTTNAGDLLAGLDTCLGQAEASLTRGGRLSVVVSDSLAAIVPLPWQGNLEKDAELRGYARICFEKQGVKLDDKWVLHVEFRRHGATGLAYALPRIWLEALQSRLEAKHLRLLNVLPVAAAAYCSLPVRGRVGLSVLLLHEQTQAAAMIWRDGRLLARDVEPATQAGDDACFRLCARLNGVFVRPDEGFARIDYWTSRAEELPKAMLEAQFPSVAVNHLRQGVWL